MNEALLDWDGPSGLPRFGEIAEADYTPAFRQALHTHLKEIDAIAANPDAPDFGNAVVALELAGKALSRVSAVFWLRAGALTNDAIKALEREFAPALSRHYSKIAQNRELFGKIDKLWQSRTGLDLSLEQFRVLERHWKGFVRSGAALPKEKQEELAAINERLATLGAQFGQNILADESSWSLHLTQEADLAGLPDSLKSAMAAAAREHDHAVGHAVTLSRSIIEPFLTFSQRRDLRETAFKAWIARGEGMNDNRPLVREILGLRHAKAAMLGYKNYAAYKLDDSMAKTPEAIDGLLMPVWEKARERAGRDAQALSELIADAGLNHALEPWDWRYFAEKRRQAEFDFSESELKPYLQLENIVAASFDVAGRLFGLSFVPAPQAPVWHEDVRAFEALDSAGKRIGIFFGDYFARPSKRSGAWMSKFQVQHRLGGGQLPFIYNVMNFAKAPPGEPALLSLDDARTLFHEFGHALHGLLSDVTYPSASGTSVSRDFVELPSQLYEHWLTVPEILTRHARHYLTGEPMPAALIEKVLAARNANSGFQTVEFTASALVDMAFHTTYDAGGENAGPMAFEAQKLAELGLPPAIVMRHRTPHFAHVFSGDGYSAGYYSYLWSEVLDADAFRAFEEAGDPFDPEMAERLRQHVFSAGGSRDPEDLYKAFRGKLPSPQAMMEGRGLV